MKQTFNDYNIVHSYLGYQCIIIPTQISMVSLLSSEADAELQRPLATVNTQMFIITAEWEKPITPHRGDGQ